MLFLRLLSRAAVGVARGPFAAPASSSLARVVLAQATRRTFVSTARLALPAATTTTAKKAKAPAKKATTKPKATAKTTTKKKTAAKKKPARAAKPKKKAVAKKAAAKPKKKEKKKPTVPRITKAQGPPPRGPSSGFVIFSNHPDNPLSKVLPIAERARQTGAQWRSMSEDEKKPYEDLAAAKRDVQELAREKWFKAVDPAFLKRYNRQRVANKKQRVRNPYRVRKPISAFFDYLFEKRAAEGITGMRVDMTKEYATSWRAMSEEERKPYLERAAARREAYVRERGQEPKA